MLSSARHFAGNAMRLRTRVGLMGSVWRTLGSTDPRQFAPAQGRRGYLAWIPSVSHLHRWTSSPTLIDFVCERIKHMQPTRVHLCDGSDEEEAKLQKQMVHAGVLIPLNPQLRPNSFLARSPPSDVARIEERTFICTDSDTDAGITNNWADPDKITSELNKLYEGCMKGRTMYVVPFSMGPIGAPLSRLGVQITDSPYAVISMKKMTRMGKEALEQLGPDSHFIPCVHSVGAPLLPSEPDRTWPSNESTKYIVQFPDQRKIWSYGSGYGGNALLGKKCFALRIASAMAKEEGWLAEHMLIVGITNPQGVKRYVAAAFPSACGKTNMAMLTPSLPGWKVECVGDDIAWMRPGKDGRLWAINPEAGFFGVAPGTSMHSNPACMKTITKNTIFTNVGMTPEGDVWWEGMTDEKPAHATSWLRTDWAPGEGWDCAHPNSRFTVSASQCPVIDPQWESPEGVPISAIIFGGRRSTTVPLVYQSRDWAHGTLIGASMASETTAAAAGARGVLRPDPFAMKPFCGYNMGDYFNHWLSFTGRTTPDKLPKIFNVNWFRKSSRGKWLWPGFGENIRVIDWILKRCDEEPGSLAHAVDTPIGYVPAPGAINTKGLPGMDEETMEELLRVEPTPWLAEVQRSRAFFKTFGERLPNGLNVALDDLSNRLGGPGGPPAAN